MAQASDITIESVGEIAQDVEWPWFVVDLTDSDGQHLHLQIKRQALLRLGDRIKQPQALEIYPG